MINRKIILTLILLNLFFIFEVNPQATCKTYYDYNSALKNQESSHCLILRKSKDSEISDYSKLNQLISLDISWNTIETISFNLPDSLQFLNISFNKLSRFPRFNRSTNLIRLILSDNSISYLTDEDLKNVLKLEELVLSGNRITNDKIDLKSLTNLKHLDLTANEIEIFPETICTLSNLEYLNIASNKIKQIPDCIGQLQKLKRLNIFNNQVTRFPVSLKTIKTLEIFLIKKNQIFRPDIYDLKLANPKLRWEY